MNKVLAGLLVGGLLTGFTILGDLKDWSGIRQVTYGIGDADFGAYCAATKISPTQLLTAKHCTDADEFTVFDNDKVVGKAKIEKRSIFADVAVLTIVEGVEGPYATVALRDALQDEVVVAAGYPLGVGEILTEGVKQGLVPCYLEYTNGVEVICKAATVTTAPVTFGNSGGGLWVYRFGHGYQLVGVASSVAIQPAFAEYGRAATAYNNLNFFVVLADIQELLADE